jgi:molybdate transport system ATP-binding protein
MIDLSIRLALEPFTLEVELALSGRVTAVVGPSGSGKTSLLEVIAGLRPRAEGRATLDGVTFLDSERRIRLPPERRQIGYVPQEPALFPHLDVASNVRYGLRSDSDESNRLVAESLALLEISELTTRWPHTLSGGEAQRVALARALVTRPRLLLLDEPLAALDAELRHRILPYLMRVRDEAKIPMIHVTHHIGEALALADDAVVLRAGRVEATGPVRNVLTPKLVTSVRGDATFENVVHGVVAEIDGEAGTAKLTPLMAASGQAATGAPRLNVPAYPGLQRGAHATYRVASEDVLLLKGAPAGISARNVFAARVTGVETLRTDVLVRLETGTLEWHALITASAVRELEIATGSEVFMAIKTHSFDRLG